MHPDKGTARAGSSGKAATLWQAPGILLALAGAPGQQARHRRFTDIEPEAISPEGDFPYLRRRGPLALIGVSSAIPTKPFVASGRLGPSQIEAVETILKRLGAEPEPPFRVAMIHHPPQPGGASPGRELKDADAFTAMIARAGADLILHGHNHVGSIAFVEGPGGAAVPVVGAPSASAVSHGGTLHRRASYHVYTVRKADDRYVIEAKERGLTEAGAIADLRVLQLTRR